VYNISLAEQAMVPSTVVEMKETEVYFRSALAAVILTSKSELAFILLPVLRQFSSLNCRPVCKIYTYCLC
jgi:hypothetical protein